MSGTWAIGSEISAALAAAGGLWVVGTLAARGVVPAGARVALTYAAAAVAVIAGLRLETSGSGVVDAGLSVLVIAATARSVERWDTCGTLAARSVVVLAAASAFVATANSRSSTAAVAAGLAGLCIALVALGAAGVRKRSSLGAGTSLFAGLTVAALALDGGSALTLPSSSLVPVLILAVPLLDAACVFLTRTRRGRLAPADAGLAGRLRARGTSWPASRLTVVASEVALGGVAVAYTYERLSAAAAFLVASTVIGTALLGFLAVPVNGAPGRLSPRARVVLGLAGLAAAAVIVPSLIAAVRARAPAAAAEAAVERGLTAARSGDSPRAAREFTEADALFAEARDMLSGPLSSLALGVPVLGQNVSAARDVARVGADISHAGARLTSSADPQHLSIDGGTVRLDEVRRLEPELANTVDELTVARERLRRIDRHVLVPTLTQALDLLDRKLDRAVSETERASDAVRLLPAILGGDGQRHYFLAVQNNAESRGTGGFIGNWGEVSARDGHVELSRFDRLQVLQDTGSPTRSVPADYKARYANFQSLFNWAALNVTPDFPTLGSLIAGLYPQSGGQPVDGVIAIDPVGLSSILELTGPITVPDWPDPITADNVVNVTLSQAYTRIADRDRRVAFLGEVAEETWHAFTGRRLGQPARILKVLTTAVNGKHLMVWFQRPDEQRLAERTGIAGSVPPSDRDQVLVTTQNVGANKIDQYVFREVHYNVRLEPEPGSASFGLRSRLDVTLRNTAPASGLATEVIGPNVFGPLPGESRNYLSVLSPLDLDSATLARLPLRPAAFDELGRRSYSLEVDVPAGGEQTVVLQLSGNVKQEPGGWYEIHLARQPLLLPDRVDVSLEVAPGYRLAEANGLKIKLHGTRATASIQLNQDLVLRARVVSNGAAGP
jgi:hypothetical protein